MLKPSEWHQQKVAEQSAHLEEEDTPLLCVAHCELCDIGIGPGHIEQDLYVYPVYDHDVLCIVNGREHLIKREKIEAEGGHWFLICGGCARSKRRNLPQSFCLLDTRHWSTTALIQRPGDLLRASTPQDLQAIWQEKDAYLTATLAWFLLVTLVAYGIPLSWFTHQRVEHLPPRCVQRPKTLASSGMALVQRHSLAS